MGDSEPPRVQRGGEPWDPANGLRVGAIAGALLAGIVTAVLGVGFVWLVFVGAVLGGAAGYWTEKRRRGRRR